MLQISQHIKTSFEIDFMAQMINTQLQIDIYNANTDIFQTADQTLWRERYVRASKERFEIAQAVKGE